VVMTRKIHVRPEPIAIPTIARRGILLLDESVLAVLDAEVAGIIEGKLDGFMVPAIEVDCAEDPSRPNDGAFVGLSLLESKLSEDMAGEALTVVVSVSVTNVVDTAAIAVESLVTVFVKDVMRMLATELLCGYQN
jgi:hypothetical protein